MFVSVCVLIHLVYTGHSNLSFPPTSVCPSLPHSRLSWSRQVQAGDSTSFVLPGQPSVMPLFSLNPGRAFFFLMNKCDRAVFVHHTQGCGEFHRNSAEASQHNQIHYVIHGTVILLKNCTFAYASTAHISRLSLNFSSLFVGLNRQLKVY